MALRRLRNRDGSLPIPTQGPQHQAVPVPYQRGMGNEPDNHYFERQGGRAVAPPPPPAFAQPQQQYNPAARTPTTSSDNFLSGTMGRNAQQLGIEAAGARARAQFLMAPPPPTMPPAPAQQPGVVPMPPQVQVQLPKAPPAPNGATPVDIYTAPGGAQFHRYADGNLSPVQPGTQAPPPPPANPTPTPTAVAQPPVAPVPPQANPFVGNGDSMAQRPLSRAATAGVQVMDGYNRSGLANPQQFADRVNAMDAGAKGRIHAVLPPDMAANLAQNSAGRDDQVVRPNGAGETRVDRYVAPGSTTLSPQSAAIQSARLMAKADHLDARAGGLQSRAGNEDPMDRQIRGRIGDATANALESDAGRSREIAVENDRLRTQNRLYQQGKGNAADKVTDADLKAALESGDESLTSAATEHLKQRFLRSAGKTGGATGGEGKPETPAAKATQPAAGPSPEDLDFTAKKYGISVDEVKRRLGAQ